MASPGGGLDTQTHVSLASGDASGHGEMRIYLAVVSFHLRWRYAQFPQFLIKQNPRSGALLAVDQGDVRAPQVFDAL